MTVFYYDYGVPSRPFHHRTKSEQALKERVQSLLNDTGLGGAKAKQKIGGLLPGGIRIKGLSGGEKRRLSLVSWIKSGQTVYIMDYER